MFSALRASAAPRAFTRAFSTTPSRADLSKLVLLGRIAREPEARLTKNDKEFIIYTVVTNGAPLPPDANGHRQPGPSTFHRVLSFNENSNKYLRSLKKGSTVYAETSFELKEPEAGADPTTPQGQRQIFLRHESIRIISQPKHASSASAEGETVEDSGNPLF